MRTLWSSTSKDSNMKTLLYEYEIYAAGWRMPIVSTVCSIKLQGAAPIRIWNRRQRKTQIYTEIGRKHDWWPHRVACRTYRWPERRIHQRSFTEVRFSPICRKNPKSYYVELSKASVCPPFSSRRPDFYRKKLKTFQNCYWLSEKWNI